MIDIPKIKRPSKEIVKKIEELGSATVSGTLYGMGITNPFIMGPTTKTPGKEDIKKLSYQHDQTSIMQVI